MKNKSRVSVQVTQNEKVRFLPDRLFPEDGKRVVEISLPSRHISTRRYRYPIYNRLSPSDRCNVHVMNSRSKSVWRHTSTAEPVKTPDVKRFWI